MRIVTDQPTGAPWEDETMTVEWARTARARIEELERERDELAWLMEHQGLSINRGDFVRSDGTRTTMVVKVADPARLATLLAAALEKGS